VRKRIISYIAVTIFLLCNCGAILAEFDADDFLRSKDELGEPRVSDMLFYRLNEGAVENAQLIEDKRGHIDKKAGKGLNKRDVNFPVQDEAQIY